MLRSSSRSIRLLYSVNVNFIITNQGGVSLSFAQSHSLYCEIRHHPGVETKLLWYLSLVKTNSMEQVLTTRRRKDEKARLFIGVDTSSDTFAVSVGTKDPWRVLSLSQIYENSTSGFEDFLKWLGQKRAFPTHGHKNEITDSQHLAEYAYRFFDEIHMWQPPDNVLKQIRTLLKTREQLTKNLSSYQSTLKILRGGEVVRTPIAEKMYEI